MMTKSKKSKNSLEVDSNSSNDGAMFLTVLYYCILIIFLPVVSFFLSKYLLTNFDISSTSQNIYAAVVAVIALHLALAIYLIKAYSDGDRPKQVVKQD